eukprot:UN04364
MLYIFRVDIAKILLQLDNSGNNKSTHPIFEILKKKETKDLSITILLLLLLLLLYLHMCFLFI